MNEFLLNLGRISPRKYLLALTVLATIYLGCGIWSTGVQCGDESRVAGICAEMVWSGDWVVPRLNGQPFLEYPPLFYQLGAICFQLFGFNDPAAAIPATLSAWGSVLILFALARKIGQSALGAFISATLLLTCAQFLVNAQLCRVDMLLAFSTLLAVYGFYAMLTESRRSRQLKFWCLGSLGVAIGILTKGLVGGALPAVALGGFLVLRDALARKLHWKSYLLLASGGIASLIPVGIWLWMLYQRLGNDALHTVIVTNNFGRFSGSVDDHAFPFYTYLLMLPEYFTPWLLLLLGGIWLALRQIWLEKKENALFILCFLLFPYLLLTISANKRMIYLLPLCAPAALVSGNFTMYLIDCWRRHNWRGSVTLLKIIRLLPLVFVLVALVGTCGGIFGFIAGTLSIGLFIASCGKIQKQRPIWCVMLSLCAIGFLIGAIESAIWKQVEPKLSLRPLFEYCQEQQHATGAEIVLLGSLERTCGAASFYLQRHIRTYHNLAEYDGTSPELWIVPGKNQQNGIPFAKHHRVYRLPQEMPLLASP